MVSKNGKAAASLLSAEELKNLFTFQEGTISDTYDSMCTMEDLESPKISTAFKNQVPLHQATLQGDSEWEAG